MAKKTHGSFQRAILADRKRRGLGVGEQATLPGTRAAGRTVRVTRKLHDIQMGAWEKLGDVVFKAFRGVSKSNKRQGN